MFWSTELGQLEKDAALLQTALRDSASSLEARDAIPEESLIAMLTAFRSLFVQVATAAGTALQSETGVSNAWSPKSIAELRSLITKVAEARRNSAQVQDNIRNALCPLEDVLKLEVRGGGEFNPLLECQSKATALRERITPLHEPEKDPEFVTVRDGTHAFCALIRFIKEWEILGLEESESLRQRVAFDFGNLLATAIMRHHILLPAASGQSQPPTASGNSALVEGERQVTGQFEPPIQSKNPSQGHQPAVRALPADKQIVIKDAKGSPQKAVDEMRRASIIDRATQDLLPGILRRNALLDVPVSASEILPPENWPQGKERTVPQQPSLNPIPDAEASQPEVAKPSPVLPCSGRSDGAAQATETISPNAARMSGTRLMDATQLVESTPARVESLRLSAGTTIENIVKLIVDGEARAHHYLIWALLREGRYALAYQVARCEEAFGNLESLPSAAIRALILSRRVRGDYGSFEEDYQRSLQDSIGYFNTIGENEQALIHACFLLSTTLAPSLLARGSGAVSILANITLKKPLESIDPLRQAVLRFANLNFDLNPGLLGGSQEHSKWVRRLADHRETCRQWFLEANQRSIIYAPTTDVWKFWLREDQPLGLMLSAVIDDQRQRAADVDGFVATWRGRGHFERQLLRADQQHRGRNAELRPIQARAVTSLRKHFDGAIDLVLRWKALLLSEPAQLDSYQSKQADQCRVAVTAQLSAAIDAMRQESVDPSHDLQLQSALAVFVDSLTALGNLFKPDVDSREEASLLRTVLGADLLRIPGVGIDDEWELVKPITPAIAAAILKIACECVEPNWDDAFESQCSAGHFENALLIIALLEHRHPEHVPTAENNLQKGLATARERLRARRTEIESRVHRSNVDGLLTEELYHRLTTLLAIDVQSCTIFGAPNCLLDDVTAMLDIARQERVDAVWERLKGLPGVSQGNDNWKRIEHVLSSDDVLTANEYLTMLEQGKALPSAEVGDPKSEFFPTFLNDIRAKVPKMPHLADIEHQLDQRRPLGPLDLNNMPKTTADEAVRLVSAWGRVLLQRRNASQLVSAVTDVLTLLGFHIVTLKGAESSVDSASLVLEAAPIRNRETCIVPYFASEARGRYRILCMWGSPLEHTILEAIERHQRDVPVIVFYMALMDPYRRRALANECRSKNRSVLVLDTYLLLYVCGHRNRLPAFFHSATWFTTGRPYTTTGAVPPEMFFGRKRQLERIVDKQGTNLVYGGRQLGKTALLREVERSYHNPSQGRVVLWIDLTHGENLGTTRAIADLWTVLAKYLADQGIGHRNTSTPERLEQSVIEWLNADPARRILLLLDEADAFMAADGAQSLPAWAQVSRLKSLMDRTQFRFKVVFAGLHNVQRTARDPNTPIAHLGEPECIGAFLSDEEMREAQAMIVKPLGALGYVFESADLPTRILAHTNYYPSLIQVFCRSLLDSLQKESFDQGSTPPYVVTLDHVEKTYRDNKTAILQRFNWSLDLDERYRVLALVIALEIVEPESVALTVGISVARIRREALGYWQQGFSGDTSTEAFRSLLEEMIGLGILRHVAADRYTLRSPNVINLLGTYQQIERQLEEAALRKPAPRYEANSFRRKLEPNAWTRSPLTAAQETELLKRENGVMLIFGCSAAGVQEVPTAVSQLPQTAVVPLSSAVSTRGQFQAEVTRLIQDRRDGLTLIVVPTECPWDALWVNEAIVLGAKHHASTARLFRIVFVGGPEHAWSWVHSDNATEDGQPTVLSLHPWHEYALSRWLDDLRVGRSEARREPLLAATGGWGYLLHDLGRELGDDPVRWSALLADAQEAVVEKVDVKLHFGIHRSASVAILKTFADFGYEADAKDSQPIAVEDLSSLLEPPLTDQASAVIRWAELLGYVRLVDASRWVLNSLLTRLLRGH